MRTSASYSPSAATTRPPWISVWSVMRFASRAGRRRRRSGPRSSSPTISSITAVSLMSGGATCRTASPRSSARAMSPASSSRPGRKPRSTRSRSSASRRVSSSSLTSSTAQKKPLPRTSPTIGSERSSFMRASQVRLVRADVLEDAVALEDLEVAQRDRGAERVPGERDAVHERALLVVVERCGDAVAHHHRAHRGVGGGEALRGRREVRRHAEALDAEPLARGARSRR